MIDNPAELVRALEPEKEFFIGIDSDGCAFDTMEIKHKECFTPNFVKHWGLQAVSKYAREAWEFANLYSKTRGANRFLTLIQCLDLLRERDEVGARGLEIPQAQAVRDWCGRETKLGNPTLEREVERTGDPVLTQALTWSKGVNASVADIVYGVPPFPLVRESLERAAPRADMMVVSSTPVEALEREWREHGIDQFVRLICGQEMGSKKEHLAMAAKDKYPSAKILMIGDAPGDRKAALANDALFFPINPGHEEESWRGFFDEGLERFFAGEFAGEYQQRLIEEFEALLPVDPPWRTA
ncbi:HAD family hydrolase [Candidatus Sumerlaeota bacterium]